MPETQGVKRIGMEYFKDIGRAIITTLRSMWVTLPHLFRPNKGYTIQYPTQRWKMPERSRGKLFNNVEDCLGDGQCARVCPTQCIEVKSEKRGKDEPAVFASDGTPKKLRLLKYDIDMSVCCYCGLCTCVCPTNSLVMTGDYEYSVYDKSELLYHFAGEKPQAGKEPAVRPPDKE
jgi:formate hydrogenlyase subunit 6/NADH:ubiquinone oxidoreductase subunit I